MEEGELEDVPPELVIVNEDGKAISGIENEIENLNLAKVPITIVTGEFFSFYRCWEQKLSE